jgi:hypothetical protein
MEVCGLPKYATDRMQRLPSLPPLLYISFLPGESLDRFLWVINTILKQQTAIFWMVLYRPIESTRLTGHVLS